MGPWHEHHHGRHHDDHHSDGSSSSSSSSESYDPSSSEEPEAQGVIGFEKTFQHHKHFILLTAAVAFATTLLTILMWKCAKAMYRKCRAREEEPLFTVIEQEVGPAPQAVHSDHEYDQFVP